MKKIKVVIIMTLGVMIFSSCGLLIDVISDTAYCYNYNNRPYRVYQYYNEYRQPCYYYNNNGRRCIVSLNNCSHFSPNGYIVER